MKIKVSLVRIFLVALLCMAFLITMPGDRQQIAAPDSTQSPLLQLTSAGHVLGFSGNSVYIAGLDHALRIEFCSDSAVMPMQEAADSQSEADTLHKVIYSSVWKNIDVIFTSTDAGISESTYIVHPGGNPASIRVRYNAPVDIQQDGSLHFAFNNGYMVESAPLAWQELDGQLIERTVAFRKDVSGEIMVTLASYDTRYPLYIDPTYSWHSFFGTVAGNDTATSITVDSDLNVYLAGFSTLPWNGPLGQAPLNAFSLGNFNTVIIKLSNSGSYLWHTYYPYAVSIGPARTVIVADGQFLFVTGGSEESWNGPAGQPPLHTYTAGRDIFALKLDQAGRYQWHTFYGSDSDDVAAGMKSANGSLYITGWAFKSWDGPAGQLPQHAYTAGGEICVLKLDQYGGYQWHTFYGGAGTDAGWVLATDSSLNVYIGGYSDETWNGPTGQTPLNAYNVGNATNDAFVLKLNNSGAYQWHTFFGGTMNDWFSAMAVDSYGNVYTLGYCQAACNGPAGQAPLHAFTDGADNVAILKLNGSGAYQWHTYYRTVMFVTRLGGGLAVDTDANVYVVGISDVAQLGPAGQAPLNPFAGMVDIVILNLNSSGNYQWHTFYGGTGIDAGIDLALDPCRNTYIGGISTGAWNGPDGRPPVNAFSIGAIYDIVALKVATVTPPSITSFTPMSGGSGTDVVITGTNLLGTTAVSFGEAPAASFEVNSSTQITAKVGTGITGIITLRTTCGRAASRDNFNFSYPVAISHGSSTLIVPPQGPVPLPSILVQSAALSALKVSPGTPVTVTANVSNTGAVNGSTKLKLYVNGQEESSQGITVSSGSSTPVTFTVIRNEPGAYSVRIGGVDAGSFTVDQFADPDIILYASAALLAVAFVTGLVFITRRRQTGR